MKYLFILTFILCFALFDTNIGYTNTFSLWTHFACQFQHAGTVHLVINSLSFIAMFRLLEKFVNRWLLSLIIVAAGFVSSFLSMYDTPTVGASAMVYAMVGMFVSIITCSGMKIPDKRKFAMFIVGTVACLSVSALKENSNFLLHLFSLVNGLIAGVVVSIYRKKR